MADEASIRSSVSEKLADRLAHFTVVTVVGKSNPSNGTAVDSSHSVPANGPAAGSLELDGVRGFAMSVDLSKCDVLYSRFNLAEGDITTVYDPNYPGDEFTVLRDLHAKREEAARETIEANIAGAEEILVALRGARS